MEHLQVPEWRFPAEIVIIQGMKISLIINPDQSSNQKDSQAMSVLS